MSFLIGFNTAAAPGRRFTQGPWYPGHLGRIDHSCECSTIVSDYYEGGIATVHVNNDKPVSDGGNDAPPYEEAVANMHMISAVTDLYEALKAAEEELRLIRMKDHATVYNPTLNMQITLAFAKADGEFYDPVST
jgi:hypothetical protein